MKGQTSLIDFVQKEWLLISSGAGLVLTSLYTKQLPSYTIQEIQVLFILYMLFIVVNGLQQSGLIVRISQLMEKGKVLPLKLVMTTFVLSMLVTNDIALMVVVPLTLALNVNRKDILVILEALAANAGSALTPLGNPQNLYIYWFYGVKPLEFIEAIAPFSLFFMGVIMVFSFFFKTRNGLQIRASHVVNRSAYSYGILFLVIILAVLHVLPVLTGVLAFVFALLVDRKALRIDYALLLSFLFFFGIADNLKEILASELNHSGHIFLFSALASQVMSNVPATLLFAKFTSNWEALLWGVNAGGFGSLFGSLANLIAYKFYVNHESVSNTAGFTARFLAIGYVVFFMSIGLYFFIYRLDNLV